MRKVPAEVIEILRCPSVNSTIAPAARRIVEAESSLSPTPTAPQDEPFWSWTLPSAQATVSVVALRAKAKKIRIAAAVINFFITAPLFKEYIALSLFVTVLTLLFSPGFFLLGENVHAWRASALGRGRIARRLGLRGRRGPLGDEPPPAAPGPDRLAGAEACEGAGRVRALGAALRLAPWAGLRAAARCTD